MQRECMFHEGVRTISVFSIATIMLTLYIAYLWKREGAVTVCGLQALIGVWLLQVGFALLDGFCLGCGREGYHTGLKFFGFVVVASQNRLGTGRSF
jgi:hypothetical protein